MYHLTDEQVDFIIRDISARGVEMESLQQQLLDHACCLIEQQLQPGGDFESFYNATIKTFYEKELREIETETIHLLTYKNYYVMKKVLIASGAVSVAAFMAGSFFKLMYWPGASFMLVLATGLFSLVFLPLLAILKTNEAKTTAAKIVAIAGALAGMLFCMGVLFAVMHWPGTKSGWVWLAAIGITAFVVLPAYLYNGIRSAETRTNTYITTIILAGVTALLFMLVQIRSHNSNQTPATTSTALPDNVSVKANYAVMK